MNLPGKKMRRSHALRCEYSAQEDAVIKMAIAFRLGIDEELTQLQSVVEPGMTVHDIRTMFSAYDQSDGFIARLFARVTNNQLLLIQGVLTASEPIEIEQKEPPVTPLLMAQECTVYASKDEYATVDIEYLPHSVEIANPISWSCDEFTVNVNCSGEHTFLKVDKVHKISESDLQLNKWSCGQLFSGILKRRPEIRPFTWSDFVKFDESEAIADEIIDRFLKNAPPSSKGTLQARCVAVLFRAHLTFRLFKVPDQVRKTIESRLMHRFKERTGIGVSVRPPPVYRRERLPRGITDRRRSGSFSN